jgi:ABC-type protease/lipase transport system fused ATPase/permease subunit
MPASREEAGILPIGIARSAVRDASLVVLDEPNSSLDPGAEARLRRSDG